MNKWTEEKPKPQKDEHLCDGCWTLSKYISGWVTYNFKYLKQSHLCPKCVKNHHQRFSELQEKGL